MTVVLLLLVAAAAAWVIWGMDRDLSLIHI